jgi:ferredoxin-NADP reductase/DMSO/TMAO reductase YedYZ heme-binding membrane subunit
MDPAIWWYVTRASAIIAWALMVTSVVWGVLLATRVLKPKDNPGWLLDLHRWMSGLAVVFTALHMISLYIDDYAHFSVADLLIPFHSQYTKIAALGAMPVVLGVLSFYLLLAVQTTSLMMRKLPRKLWKSIHYTSYVTVALVSFHAGWTGTDVRNITYQVVAIGLVALATIATIVRIVWPRSAKSLSARVERRRPAQLKQELRTVRIVAATNPAKGILGLELVDAESSVLPSWIPGSHITIHLPDGSKRQYSLCGDPANRERYEIAVALAQPSRGGSSWLHANARVDLELTISGPHNHFELDPAKEYLFIAGGIGITPIKSMLESLPAKRNWRLLYVGRSRSTMAFADELVSQFGDRVQIHASDEHNGARVHLPTFLKDNKAPVYVCGPEPLLDELITLVPSSLLHFERFAAIERDEIPEPTQFAIQLGRGGPIASVAADETMLDAVNRAGGQLISSCGEGVCGTCEVRVLDGTPLHLDSVMSDDDKNEIGVMYPCVSRSTSSTLVLDL